MEGAAGVEVLIQLGDWPNSSILLHGKVFPRGNGPCMRACTRISMRDSNSCFVRAHFLGTCV